MASRQVQDLDALLELAGVDIKARTYSKFLSNSNYIGNPMYLKLDGAQVEETDFYKMMVSHKIFLDYEFALKSLEDNIIRAAFIKRDNTVRVIYATNSKKIHDLAYQKFGQGGHRKYNPKDKNLLPCIDLQLLKHTNENPFRLINLNTLVYWEKYSGEIPLPNNPD